MMSVVDTNTIRYYLVLLRSSRHKTQQIILFFFDIRSTHSNSDFMRRFETMLEYIIAKVIGYRLGYIYK